MEVKKTDVESSLVWGFATTDALDKEGDIISEIAVKNAIGDYKKWRNIREMHHQKTVGIAKYLFVIPGRGLLVGAAITDKNCLEMIRNGHYRAFSIGGIVHDRSRRFVNGKLANVVTSMTIAEISVVDQPANNEAEFIWVENTKKEESELFEKWLGKVMKPEDGKDKLPEELLLELTEKVKKNEGAIESLLEIFEKFNDSLESLKERLAGIESKLTAKKSVEGQAGGKKTLKWESIQRLIS
ncbi:MAG: XkdF-like putative serine protease domain-containing protein [Caldisericia bacterium]